MYNTLSTVELHKVIDLTHQKLEEFTPSVNSEARALSAFRSLTNTTCMTMRINISRHFHMSIWTKDTSTLLEPAKGHLNLRKPQLVKYVPFILQFYSLMSFKAPTIFNPMSVGVL